MFHSVHLLHRWSATVADSGAAAADQDAGVQQTTGPCLAERASLLKLEDQEIEMMQGD